VHQLPVRCYLRDAQHGAEYRAVPVHLQVDQRDYHDERGAIGIVLYPAVRVHVREQRHINEQREVQQYVARLQWNYVCYVYVGHAERGKRYEESDNAACQVRLEVHFSHLFSPSSMPCT